MNAKEYLEKVSPNTNAGIREKLIRKGMLNITCSLMEAYTVHREKILSNEREVLVKHEQKRKCATDKYGEPISAYDLNKVGGFNKH